MVPTGSQALEESSIPGALCACLELPMCLSCLPALVLSGLHVEMLWVWNKKSGDF